MPPPPRGGLRARARLGGPLRHHARTIHDLLAEELGYDISGLDGDGPYNAERFIEIFASGERVNFVARPRL